MAATNVAPRAKNAAANSSRLSTETKASAKTSELYAYVVVLVGLLLAGLMTMAGDGHDDRLQADQVWLYASILTFGYMVSRGLAKSGSRDPYWNDSGDNRNRENNDSR